MVKCFLSVRGTDLEVKHEHHGLQIPLGEKLKVQVPGRTTSGVNIFHRFSKEFDISPTVELIDVKDIMKHIPELHQISFSLGLLPNNQRCFLPVNIDLLTDENEHFLFSEIRYSKKQESLVRTSKFLSGERRKYFRDPREENGQIIVRCKRRKSFTWDTLPRIYQNIIKEYSKFGIAMLLTRDGYKYYIDLETPRYHHLCYSLMFMFYLGTVTRYRPSETEEILSSELRPAITEALATSPNQFLYQMVGIITGKVCVVPYSYFDTI